jgi:hypothetical protein
MTPNPHGPLKTWATLVLQWPGQRDAKPQGEANPIKPGRGLDWSLQLDSTKMESLVTVNQHVTVNTFSGFVLTARQVRRERGTRSSCLSGPKVTLLIRTKS